MTLSPEQAAVVTPAFRAGVAKRPQTLVLENRALSAGKTLNGEADELFLMIPQFIPDTSITKCKSPDTMPGLF